MVQGEERRMVLGEAVEAPWGAVAGCPVQLRLSCKMGEESRGREGPAKEEPREVTRLCICCP